MTELTKNQTTALRWLKDHGGDGVFDKNGVLLAMGERAPCMRATWNALRDAGHVEFYNQAGKGHGRCRLTQEAKPGPIPARTAIVEVHCKHCGDLLDDGNCDCVPLDVDRLRDDRDERRRLARDDDND